MLFVAILDTIDCWFQMSGSTILIIFTIPIKTIKQIMETKPIFVWLIALVISPNKT